MSEGSSFMKGMILGGIFCLVLSFFGTFNSGTHSEGHEHLHHHLKPASKDELLKFSESQMSDLVLQVQVYCLIMVTPKLLVHWATANDTWSKHCDKSVFYTSESSKALEAVRPYRRRMSGLGYASHQTRLRECWRPALVSSWPGPPRSQL